MNESGFTAERIARLSPARRALLDQLAASGGQSVRPAGQSPDPGDSGLQPLSFAQERMWVLDRLQPDSAVYNVAFRWTLVGSISSDALSDALNDVMHRHRTLTSRFSITPDGPVQTPVESLFPLDKLDVSQQPMAERGAACDKALSVAARCPFDLSRPPLARALLVRRAASEHVLLIVIHHIASDGWSHGVLVRELSFAYAARINGRTPAWTPLLADYQDYVDWQRQWLSGDVLARQLTYWRKQLNGLTPMELPLDKVRPVQPSYRGDVVAVRVPAGLTAALNALARRNRVTLHMVLLSALQTLLMRYSGQADIAIGTPVAGRSRREHEQLIGLFVNTLVLRGDLSGNPRFTELLTRTREFSLDAYDHQQVPFEKLVVDLEPVRDMSRNPLFQVNFVLQNTPDSVLDLAGVRAVSAPVHTGTSKFDLGLSLTEVEGVLAGNLEYSTDLFHASTVEQMARHWLNLLQQVVDDPDRRIDELTLLSDAERHRLLVEWNDTAADYPRDKRIHELFEAQVARTPHAKALVFKDQELSYRQLNERANALAHRLIQIGVEPGMLAGLCVERSPDLLVGILGILKTGAAYVPLDPRHPAQRLEYVLEDAAIRHLVTQRALQERVPFGDAQVTWLDEPGEAGTGGSADVPAVPAGAGELAYVLYTSGSTGRPKGVPVRQSAVVNLLYSTAVQTGFTAADRFLSVTTPTFDISVLELLLPLISGASVEIVPQDLVADPGALSVYLESSSATVMQATPATWQMLVNGGWVGRPDLTVLCGGEALSESLADALCNRSARLLNGYGPTETTIYSTMKRVERDRPAATTIPIGRPLANTQVYVLDAGRQPVPIGVRGELYIGGDGLAPGYLNAPELTAERFVPDVFSNRPGARLYRTGDACRWRADGDLEYLGRLDNQVKLRGFRIEPGEIEAVLLELPEVAQTVVTLREDRPGDKRLVAYVVSASGQALSRSDLREHLRGRLPDYMIPSAFVDLSSLPMTPSGKIDRRALPPPEDKGSEPATGYVPPGSAMQGLLVQIWNEVLGLDQVGIHDNFFDLGGHSLLAAQVSARLKSATRMEVPLAWIFDAPTVAELAERLSAHTDAATQIEVSAQWEEPRATPGRIPLSFAQERMWFLHQMQDGNAAYNLPIGLRLRGPLDVEALRRSVEEIIRRHEPLRTSIVIDGEQPIQIIRPPRRFDLPHQRSVLDDPARREAETAAWCQQQASVGFDLGDGLMLRAELLQLDENDHVLMVVMHHIASDGWSTAVLLRELSTLYKAFSAGDPSPLPDLPMRYAEYSRWQRELLQGELERGLLDYWRERLRDAPAVLELPADWPRPETGAQRGEHCDLNLTTGLSSAIDALGRQMGTTKFTVLLTTFQLLLSRLSGQHDVVVGIPVAGRIRSEHEPLIGLFLNVLAIRTDLSAQQTFRDLLKQVHQHALAAYEHQQLPFDRLVQSLQPERSLAYSPLVQVLFNGGAMAPPQWQSPELAIEPVSNFVLPSKYDLTVYVQQSTDQIHMDLVYNPDLFSAGRMGEFLEQYRFLLEQVADAPDRSIGSFELLTASAGRLLPDPRVEMASPVQVRVTDQVQRFARRSPERIAVVRGNSEWRYAELWFAAQRILEALQKQGVGPGTPIAVYGRVSFGLVSTVVGVLHGDAVLVLIDPKQPPPRQRFMAEHAGCRILVAVGEFTPDAQALARDRGLLQVDGEQGEATLISDVPRGQREPSPAARFPEDSAYVFYTSGTTGTPKGVIGSNEGLSHFINWQRDQFAVGPDDRIAQVTGISFDVVMREIFLPLTSGARLCIPEGSVDDPSVLWPWLDQQRVTILHGVPSRLQNWLSLIPEGVSLQDFRLLFMAGEPLMNTLVNAWRTRFSGDIVNLYGPTETTLAKSWYRVPSTVTLHGGMQPIGSPLPQTQLLVMQTGGQRCGIGELGEIVIRTPFRSLGYLDTEQTRERFRPNPFSGDPDDLLYHTGDLGRVRPDGVLEIAGRLDDQIKIGGVRVEPAEVKSILSLQPDVASCHVGAVTGADGAKKLLAWVVPREGTPLQHEVLQKFLGSRLPGVMIPARFVMLRSMPLTPNGKVDRRALPLPDETRPTVATGHVAPRSEVERDLARIWSDVLGVESPGIHDDFFALGGHSLLATRVKARIASSMKVDVPLPRMFEAPTIAELAGDIEAIRSQGTSAVAAPLVRIDRESNGPPLLSFAQQRLWFLEQMEGEATAWNLSYAWAITGNLNVDALVHSFQAIVARHEPLRTTFRLQDQDQEPVQLIATADRKLVVEVVDLTVLSPALAPALAPELVLEQQNNELASRRRREMEKPFDLEWDLMLRASLLKFAPDRHVMLLTMHHIATDGTSLRLLWRELDALYVAFSNGTTPQLPELPVRYADFGQWQRQMLQGVRLESLMHYWRTQLAGLEPLELPTDRPRPPRMSHQGGRHDFELPAELVARLHALSQTTGVTLHMLLLAAFQILLSRYARQDDIAVGVPMAGRLHTELENLIGFFVNTVVIRVDLSGSPTVNELLVRVRQASLAAYEHQEIPFEKLVEELRPERHLDRAPLVQVMFQLLNLAEQNLHLDGLGVSALPSLLPNSSERVNYDIELNLLPQGAALAGIFRYSTDLFEAGTIIRMAGHFRILLEGIADDPQRPIDELPLLGNAERQQVIRLWNDTAAGLAEEQTVHGLFEGQAAKTPDRLAVIFADQQLTYGELNARANRLAHHLLGIGVAAQARVALFVERSLDLVVGILGVLKAGAAYVPLDPDHPAQRLGYMLQDAGVRLLVTQTRLLDRLPQYTGEVVCVDQPDRWSGSPDSTHPSRKTDSSDLAYVTYTSGSTGQPKGVQVRHSAVVNLLQSMAVRPGITASDRLLSVTTPTFDISVLELMLPLSVGACVGITPAEVVGDPAALSASIDLFGATIMQATPTTWQMLVIHGWKGRSGLTILCGGESLPHPLAVALADRSDALWNLYGPTETTIWSTICRVCDNSRPGSIGGPIANTQVYVLDEKLQPVPVGVPGELCIGGAGVSPGYLNRPELTAARFVIDAFSADPRTCLYRTGDLVRWRAEGDLEFLGRLDEQVKLRGFRIEPGEIEAALMSHPAVAQAVVALREDRPADPWLVAYLVSDATGVLDEADVRFWLRGRLPEHMQPAVYVVLDRLPLTASGKVDRKSLPAPGQSNSVLAYGFVAPRTTTEVQIAEIWCEVLQVARVGIHDNFFALGGHSLLAARVMTRVRASLQIEAPLRTLFEAPTIGELADRLAPRRPLLIPVTAEGRFLGVVRPVARRGNVICVGGHVVEWLQELPADVGILCLGSGSVEPERFHGFGIAGAVKRYMAELEALDLQGRQVIVGYGYSGLVAYALGAQLRQAINTPVDVVMLEPALRVPRQVPATTLMGRLGRAAVKVFSQGPGVFANAWRRRHLERADARETEPVDDDLAAWNAIPPGLRRNIAAYRPMETESRGIHLVAGRMWLDRHLDRFRAQLVASPQIHEQTPEQGEFTPDYVVEDARIISRWRQVIIHLLTDL